MVLEAPAPFSRQIAGFFLARQRTGRIFLFFPLYQDAEAYTPLPPLPRMIAYEAVISSPARRRMAQDRDSPSFSLTADFVDSRVGGRSSATAFF